jgi:hypothetical protein
VSSYPSSYRKVLGSRRYERPRARPFPECAPGARRLSSACTLYARDRIEYSSTTRSRQSSVLVLGPPSIWSTVWSRGTCHTARARWRFCSISRVRILKLRRTSRTTVPEATGVPVAFHDPVPLLLGTARALDPTRFACPLRCHLTQAVRSSSLRL